MGFREIEDLLMKFQAEEALELINKLPEIEGQYANVYKAEAMRILGKYQHALKLCNSVLEKEFTPNKLLFHANLIKSYSFFRIEEHTKSEESFYIAEGIYTSLSLDHQEQYLIWYGILIHLKVIC